MSLDQEASAPAHLPTAAQTRVSDVTPQASRREVLKLAGVGAGALALAACGSGTNAASDTSSTGASSVAASGTAIIKLSDVEVGKAASATLDGKPVIVSQPEAGNAVAFSAICTHMACTVAPGATELDCPCHGSKYNWSTGAVISGPAPRPLESIAVTVKDGEVVTA